jgi:hypothetical protein
MQCPVCQKELIPQDFGGVKVDVCKDGCKGLWFDWVELGKLDQKNEGLGEALQEALGYPRTNDENRPQINCPKCGISMIRHKFESQKEVNVDECYQCGGFFIDSGELKMIRDNFMSEKERKDYVDNIINQNPALEKILGDLGKDKIRNKAARSFAGFLQANYYIPVK